MDKVIPRLVYCHFQFKLEDMWVGAFWRTCRVEGCPGLQLWVCLIPCVPLYSIWKLS